MRMASIVGIGVLAVFLGVGAAGAGAPEAPAGGAGPAVVARVNQVELTREDFQTRLRMLEQERGPVAQERYGEILRALVREEILYQAAQSQGLAEDPTVKRRMEVARRQVIIEELLRRRVETLTKVTEEDVRKAYEENKPLFSTEAVGASHIMVKTEAEAEGIRTELKAGKAFAELAKEKSEDQGSASKGGDLGMLTRGQTEPEFEAAAFALKEGDVSEVVKTQYGYHVIKGGPHSTTVQPFEEVKDKIQEMLAKQKQRDALMVTMMEFESKAATELFEDRLR
jgi:peptidyl-prolyl cis-trans isomerase C